MHLRRQGILERCLKRLEWDKVQSREAKAAADAKEAERLAMQSIDWCAWPCRSRHFHDPSQLQAPGQALNVPAEAINDVVHSAVPGSDVLCRRLGRHDFVVVETIDFYEDEEAELPPPMSLRDVQARL
jgi:splicing factor 3A subunit 1